ncbi:MAG TPA: hypothetical protein VLL76_02365, partial [Candidatus Omnitrophota bacterium]|nr:hypothetical protein [Candidatus Omnitrophota bacterium]
TEATRVASTASNQAVENSVGDMLAGKEYMAVMDQFTRPDHAARHGKFYRRQGPNRYVADDGEIFPGDHWTYHCRCIGLDVFKAPEEFRQDPALAADFRREGVDNIPDPPAYQDWFAAAGQAERKRAVGVRRLRAVEALLGSDRRPQWADFIEQTGRLLSPQELAAETPAAKAARLAAVDAMLAERKRLFAAVVGSTFFEPAGAS